MPLIPAICLNPSCNMIFPSGFEFVGSAIFTNNLAGPCPRCGGMGKIPDGDYQSLHNGIFVSLFNISDIEKLTKIKQILESTKNNSKFKEKLETTAPELTNQISVFEWAKENQTILDLIIKFITVLIAVLAYFKTNSAPLNITQQTIINQAFYQFYNPSAPIPHVSDLTDSKRTQKK